MAQRPPRRGFWSSVSRTLGNAVRRIFGGPSQPPEPTPPRPPPRGAPPRRDFGTGDQRPPPTPVSPPTELPPLPPQEPIYEEPISEAPGWGDWVYEDEYTIGNIFGETYSNTYEGWYAELLHMNDEVAWYKYGMGYRDVVISLEREGMEIDWDQFKIDYERYAG